MKYWYSDNWSGDCYEFATLNAAKAAAVRETGLSIVIYHNDGSIACVVAAKGGCPA